LCLLGLVSGQCGADDKQAWQEEMDNKLSKSLSVDFDGVEVSKVMEYFRQRTGVNIILDMGGRVEREPRVTLKLNEVQAESALAWAVRLSGLTYVVRNQAVYVAPERSLKPEWRAEMRRRYARRLTDRKRGWMRQVNARLAAKIDVVFRNEPMDRAAEQLASKGGLNIVVDANSVKTSRPVNYQAKGMTVENAIKWTTELAGLRYTLRDEVIYVASQKDMVKLQLETGQAAVPARFRQPVSFEFKETDLMRALRHLQQMSGVAIEVPNVPAGDYRVTLKDKDVELHRAVSLVLSQTGLGYAVSYRGETMVILLRDKADPKDPGEGKRTEPEKRD